MSSNDTGSDLSIDFSLEADASGKVVAKGTLPASLPTRLIEGLAKAEEHAIAGIAPGFYRQAVSGVLWKQVQKESVDRLCAGSGGDNNELLSFLLQGELLERARKVESRAGILHETALRLKSASDTDTSFDSIGTIEEDFLSHYWDMADKVTTAELRNIFSRILAKEICQPGSFSPATLNLLAILHPEIAQKFELLCTMTFQFGNLSFVICSMPHKNAPSTKSNRVGSSKTKGESLVDFAISREDLLDLRSVGLIRSTGSEEYPDLTEFLSISAVEFADRSAKFSVASDAPRETGFSITDATNVISLTRGGSELRSIISLAPHPLYTSRLIEVMETAGVSMTVEE